MPSYATADDVGIFMDKMADGQENIGERGRIERNLRQNKASDQARRLFDFLGYADYRLSISPVDPLPWPRKALLRV